MPRNKERLDNFLVREGFFPSREKARSAIMAGLIYVNDQRMDKAGTQVSSGVQVEVRGNALKYVSRGGLKLEKAITAFSIDMRERIVLDVGASTGGFTDCALQHGARLVYAVDVGYGQLAWSLRTDLRVVSLERTNIRYLSSEKFTHIPDFVTIDVSFISLAKVLAQVDHLTAVDAEGVALIKPQFEAGPERVGKKGVVREASVHIDVIFNILSVVNELNWSVLGLDFSPIRGPEGNIEYLLYFTKKNVLPPDIEQLVPYIVEQAHKFFG
ncbi:hemolysin A [Desulfofarcimen acetoxidans DSM 771]|uniref:Hemolysin A n=1 Tax=Desulfofarcimen acetoxidans (strain ATCC 49208 / DSM 771 / KCTC 5769 / VKM B-1644 / 5575) TaxID=485916 RepID=C8W0Y0_DESAS|nr:TlyA family RNA methyltransferase [Desulfofarcimen acetoxidans]ACV63376.1 hemolysin A [Desulfofarcimen acetoxidans DSM 771]